MPGKAQTGQVTLCSQGFGARFSYGEAYPAVFGVKPVSFVPGIRLLLTSIDTTMKSGGIRAFSLRQNGSRPKPAHTEGRFV
ncbi:MAG: hypothetical protein NVS9B4_07130 [Candidatus Acidiferrum sp.]